MIKESEFKGNEAIVTYKFSEDDIKILKHLKENNCMDFRKGENVETTYNLLDYGFVTTDDDSCTLLLY